MTAARLKAVVLMLALAANTASSQTPPSPDIFHLGVYADSARTLECVEGTPASTFRLHVYVWVPEGPGGNYITVRMSLPESVGLTGRLTTGASVANVIVTDYGNGGEEWNFFLSDCPHGWILLAWQDSEVLYQESAEVAISGQFSLARNCDFVFEDIDVINNLGVGTGACASIPVSHTSWGIVKAAYK